MPVIDVNETPAYTIPEASHYLSVSASTLRAWFAGYSYSYRGKGKRFQRVIVPADAEKTRLSFSNLIEAYVLTAIRRKHSIGLPTVRRGLAFVQEKLGVERPLLQQQFATKGAQLFVEHLGQIINLSRNGQIEITEAIQAYLERVERDTRGLPIKLYPFIRSQPLNEQPRSVVIDPRLAFGRPVVAGTSIPTAVLAEQFKAGDLPSDLAKEYGAEEEAVWDAIRCELDRKVA
jgi:uncharacterized protein (DUF433 family)